MKLILENWKRFLTENESKYFPWIDDLYSDPKKFIQDQFDKRGVVGTGSFRTVVVPDEDKDFVVKIIRYGESDSFMNKVEKILGDEYPDVFPKVYAPLPIVTGKQQQF